MTGATVQQEANQALEPLLNDPQTDTVTLAVTDGFGRLMGKRLTKPFFAGKSGRLATRMSTAIFSTDFRLQPVPGLTDRLGGVAFADFDAVADTTTACRAPWAANEVLLLCDEVRQSGDPVPVAPRQVLRTQIEAARAKGISLRFASELEFHLLPNALAPTRQRRASEAERGRQDYHLGLTQATEHVMRAVRNRLTASEMAVEYHKGEAGVGQHEIVLGHAEPLRAGDMHVIFKHSVKRVCAGHGRVATFLPMLAENDDASGGHIHCSLDQPALTAAFAAGVLAHAAELMPFFAPLVVSYKRFRLASFGASFVPRTLTWGEDDRASAIRLIDGASGPRFEFRVPGADVNPYLAYAALIAAGLAGIDEGLTLKTVSAEHLPASLQEACARFEASRFARAVLGGDIVEYYARLLGHEAALFGQAVTDWEIERYFQDA